MRATFSHIEHDAFAVAVSRVEGITFSEEDDKFFHSLRQNEEAPEVVIKRVLERALLKV
jgi:hypothetical protein